MLEMLALGALSLGGNVLSGIGAKQASAKQARLQMIADAQAAQANAAILADVNAKREALGRELLTIPEVTTETVSRDDGSYTTSHSSGGVDYKRMMADAEASGFNPVTWLNAGAMSHYGYRDDSQLTQNFGSVTTTTTRSGHNAADAFKIMVPEYQLQQASQVPQQHSVLQGLGNGLTSAANTMAPILSTQMQIDAKSSMLDKTLAASIKNAGVAFGNSLSGGGTGGGSALSLGGATGVNRGLSVSTKGKTDDDPLAQWMPYPEAWKRGDVNVTNPWSGVSVDKGSADAEHFEARYGDIAQEIAGASNATNDMILNFTNRSPRNWGRETGFNVGDYPGNTAYEKFGNWLKTLPAFGSSPQINGPWQ